MADEDVTLDGKSLQSLRVADLKAALEHRHLPKSGAKNALIKRLKGALMLENVKKTSTSHIGLQPNSQIGEEMSQNSFIKQYLAQQQELLRQRLEREAREAAEADAGETGPEEEEEEEDDDDDDDTEQDNDSASYHPDKHCPIPSQPPLARAEEGGGPMMGQGMMSQGMGKGMMSRRPHFGPGSMPQESPDAPGSWMQQRLSLHTGPRHEEPATPSPPRAVASLSVRVLGDPERQGLPPSVPPRVQAQENEGTAPADDDRPAHYVLHLSRSARAAASAGGNRVQEDSDDDEDDSSEEDEDEWGPAAGARRGVGGGGRGGRSPPPRPQQLSPSVPVGRERSRRKLQPPQHIPPQQVVHQPPMQLRQPTPPPSPPPELSFPLPDTPKQSPPDMDEEPEGAGAGVAVRSPPGGLQRQDSDSSSRSSSPEPLAQRRPGPLSLLARKMASEGAFGKRGEGASDGQTGPGGESSGPGDGGSSVPEAGPGVGVVLFPGAAITHIGGSSAVHSGTVPVPDVPAPVSMFGSGAQFHPLSLVSGAAVPSITLTAEPQGPSGETAQKRTEKEKKQVEEREMKQVEKEKQEESESCLPPWKHGRDVMSVSSQFGSGGSEVPAVHQGDSPKKSPFDRDEPLSSPPGSTTYLPDLAPKKPRMFSDTSSGSMASPPKPGQQGSVVVTTPGEPPLKQEVLISGAQQDTDNTIEVTSPKKASAEKPGWKTGGDIAKTETESDSQAEKETPKAASETRRRGPEEAVEVEPMGPVLPPSYPGKGEEEKKRKEDVRKKEEERCRQRKKASDRRSSPSSGDSSSSDSDSGSSSSRSSGSTSSRDKKKKSVPGKGHERRRLEKGGEKKQPSREKKQSSLSEPSGPGPMEVEERPDPEDSRVPQPTPEGDPENSEGRMEESTTPKALATRSISLTTGSKPSPEGAGEAESGTAAGRKRRWGSSTAVTTKKPSISITTDSLKSLIPDIKPSQDAVMDLHTDDSQLSGDEDTPTTREDQGLDKDLKIRRTVTQVVPGESHENGQGEREEEEVENKQERERTHKEKRKNSYSEDTMVSQSSTTHDAKKVTPSDSLVRRSISQQKSGVSVTIDDPVRTDKLPSPPRGKVSNIVHVCNLVRPFTLGQLKELLNRTGSVVEEGFWIDKIKSHCYVTYSSTEEAVATRAALYGVKWPQSNPKVLSVDYCEQNELDFHRGLLTVDPREEHRPQPAVGPGGPKVRPGGLPPLMPERDGRADRGAVGGVRDQWAEREREMERRERTRAEREWDRDKVRDFGGKPGEERERGRRSRSLERERRRKEREGKEKKTDKKDEPPVKLLDDLFNKTKAAPCIYWLPLTEEQANQRGKEREERQKERERRRKEQQEEEDKKREEERKERMKSREEGGAAVSTGVGSVRGSEGDRDREGERGRDREGERGRDREGERGRDREGERGRDREGERGRDREGERGRDREGERGRDRDKRKDIGAFKPKGPDAKPLSGFRRSRSRSNLRDRRR